MVCNTGLYIHRKRVNWSWERRNREAWGCCIPPDDQRNRGARDSSALPSLPAIILWVPCHLLWWTQGQVAIRGEFDNWSWFFIWCDCCSEWLGGSAQPLLKLQELRVSWEVVHNPIFFPGCLLWMSSPSSICGRMDLLWKAVTVAGRGAMHR